MICKRKAPKASFLRLVFAFCCDRPLRPSPSGKPSASATAGKARRNSVFPEMRSPKQFPSGTARRLALRSACYRSQARDPEKLCSQPKSPTGGHFRLRALFLAHRRPASLTTRLDAARARRRSRSGFAGSLRKCPPIAFPFRKAFGRLFRKHRLSGAAFPELRQLFRNSAGIVPER